MSWDKIVRVQFGDIGVIVEEMYLFFIIFVGKERWKL